MHGVINCHQILSLFGTEVALQLVSEVGCLKKRTWTPLGDRFLREQPLLLLKRLSEWCFDHLHASALKAIGPHAYSRCHHYTSFITPIIFLVTGMVVFSQDYLQLHKKPSSALLHLCDNDFDHVKLSNLGITKAMFASQD